MFSALGEPNRLRIVELLDVSPRSVGEIAAELGLRQPQTTKHLQTLQRVGLVTVHPLAQRRVYSLRRERFREVRDRLEGFAARRPADSTLADYENAIGAEQRLAAADPGWAVGRTLTLDRELPAPAELVWTYWTTADLVRRWWSPEHFDVVECEIEPSVGGRLEIVMQERDGSRHRAGGRFLQLTRPSHLRYELGPLAADGSRLLSAIHDVTLRRHASATKLSLTIRVTTAAPEAAPALAGMELGWRQLLDKLAGELDRR